MEVEYGKSVLSKGISCWVCGGLEGTRRYDIVFSPGGASVSREQGCWCWLCRRHREMTQSPVNSNNVLLERLRTQAQKEWEKRNGGRKAFIEVFGKSYL